MRHTGAARLISFSLLIALAALAASGAAPAHGASFTVDATHDAVDASPGDGVCADAGGACTLRAAIMETNALPGADEISLPAGTYVLTIPGTNEDSAASGDLDITDDLSIEGAGREVSTIDGNQLDVVLTFLDGVSSDASELTIQNGLGSFHGGIFNLGELTLDRVSIIDNAAGIGIGSGNGGAVSNLGTLTMSETLISGNSATVSGGGIANSGEATITDSRIAGNTSDDGGGIFNSGSLDIVGSTVNGNSAADTGGGISSFSGSVSVISVTLEGNDAGRGGAIHNGANLIPLPIDLETQQYFDQSIAQAQDQADLTVSGSVITGNRADNGAGIYNSEPGEAGISGVISISDSAISHNAATQDGGGIFNGASATANVGSSTVKDNSAGGSGGGIANDGFVGIQDSASGVLTITETTISANSALFGAGISNAGMLTLVASTIAANSGIGVGNAGNDTIPGAWGMANITNSTVSGNSGDGISNGGGMTLTNMTVAFNSGNGLSRGFTGGIGARNTIIAHNSEGDCDTAFTVSSGHNLDSDGTCGDAAPGDLSNVDPLLDPLADNGGPTQTHALLAGSPAIDGGDNTGCPATDQRGVERPQDGDANGSAVCDIGAYELQAAATSTPSPITLPSTGGAGSEVSIPLTVAALAALPAIVLAAGAVALGRRALQRD